MARRPPEPDYSFLASWTGNAALFASLAPFVFVFATLKNPNVADDGPSKGVRGLAVYMGVIAIIIQLWAVWHAFFRQGGHHLHKHHYLILAIIVLAIISYIWIIVLSVL